MALEETIDIEPDPEKETIHFGKYKGSTIASLPTDYLAYLMDDIDSLEERNPWVAGAIKKQWAKR